MKTNTDRLFLDERIDLTGEKWLMCIFDGCVLELNKTSETYMAHCTMTDCQLIGDGWPDTILEANARRD